MRAITLWQPWASLIAYGIKTRETRTWRPQREAIGTRIAIHAAARPMKRDEVESPILRALPVEAFPLPLGVVVATARIALIEMADGEQLDPYGDYELGRFFWQLADIHRLDPAIPARGAQRLWWWNGSDPYRAQGEAGAR